MIKTLKKLGAITALAAVFFFGTLISQNASLEHGLVRLHVVAASDSQYDQSVKLKVRDAVLRRLDDTMARTESVLGAKVYITQNLPQLEEAANETLNSLGVSDRARVTFCREGFPQVDYENFSLPAGVYDALRVTIGEGKGHNWWCVIYPTLCTGSGAQDSAAFSPSLKRTIQKEDGTELRFYLLDKLGALKTKLTEKKLS